VSLRSQRLQYLRRHWVHVLVRFDVVGLVMSDDVWPNKSAASSEPPARSTNVATVRRNECGVTPAI
jgi:hypothetical protein